METSKNQANILSNLSFVLVDIIESCFIEANEKLKRFQFYLSSIKSPGRLPQEGVDDGFNSTLVQLKVEHS